MHLRGHHYHYCCYGHPNVCHYVPDCYPSDAHRYRDAGSRACDGKMWCWRNGGRPDFFAVPPTSVTASTLDRVSCNLCSVQLS